MEWVLPTLATVTVALMVVVLIIVALEKALEAAKARWDTALVRFSERAYRLVALAVFRLYGLSWLLLLSSLAAWGLFGWFDPGLPASSAEAPQTHDAAITSAERANLDTVVQTDSGTASSPDAALRRLSGRVDWVSESVVRVQARLDSVAHSLHGRGGTPAQEAIASVDSLVSALGKEMSRNRQAVRKLEGVMLTDPEALVTVPVLVERVDALRVRVRELDGEVTSLRDMAVYFVITVCATLLGAVLLGRTRRATARDSSSGR
jgi:hypothetical protein